MASIDIVDRLRFDAARCEATFSKGVSGNITEAADEIERLRLALKISLGLDDGTEPGYEEAAKLVRLYQQETIKP